MNEQPLQPQQPEVVINDFFENKYGLRPPFKTHGVIQLENEESLREFDVSVLKRIKEIPELKELEMNELASFTVSWLFHKWGGGPQLRFLRRTFFDEEPRLLSDLLIRFYKEEIEVDGEMVSVNVLEMSASIDTSRTKKTAVGKFYFDDKGIEIQKSLGMTNREPEVDTLLKEIRTKQVYWREYEAMINSIQVGVVLD